MFPALSLPMEGERSRNKERLEASLSGLCELELLRQRQESRVLSALSPGDSVRPPWEPRSSTRRPTTSGIKDAKEDVDIIQTRSPLFSEESGSNLPEDQSFTGSHHPPRIGQEGSPGQSAVQSTSCCISIPLEQQVAELKVNTQVTSGEPIDVEDSSGKYLIPSGSIGTKNQPVNSRSPSVLKESREPETDGKWLSDPIRPDGKTGDGRQQDYQPAQKVETYILGLIQRRALSTRPVKPRTSLPSVFRQSSLCCQDEQHLNKVSLSESSPPSQAQENAPQASLNHELEHYTTKGPAEDALNLYHHRLEQNVQYQLGLYNRPQQPSKIHATSFDYSSCRVLQSHQDSDPSDPDSSQYLHNSSSPQALMMPHQPASQDEQLVNAEYIPAQPCRASTRAYTHRHSTPKGPGMTKPNRSTYSPERSHRQDLQPTAPQNQPSRLRGGPKKCRSNEDRNGTSRKAGKKACRSQSEYSLPRAPERKYNTVERDGGGSGSGGRGSRSSQSKSKKQQQGCGSYRHWQSSLELNQDEADLPPTQDASQIFAASNQNCPRRTRKSRTTNASYVHLQDNHHQHHQSNQQQHEEYQRDQVPLCQASEDYPHPSQADSESSLSEADSPDSSTLSSDSDESGGLVWPQQLSSQPSNLLPPVLPGAASHPKAFVKIKASHALKKKILRFRSGSLKLMTTV